MSADRMPTGRGIAQLSTVPDSERRDGGPELVIRGELRWTPFVGQSGEHIADVGDTAVLTTPDGEPLQRKGRPGAVSQEVFQMPGKHDFWCGFPTMFQTFIQRLRSTRSPPPSAPDQLGPFPARLSRIAPFSFDQPRWRGSMSPRGVHLMRSSPRRKVSQASA